MATLEVLKKINPENIDDELRPLKRPLTPTERILQKAGQKLGTNGSKEYPPVEPKMGVQTGLRENPKT